ncbi:hypothetical protein KY346_04480 [Candidatus Woesearchaeota archaeon]|nr:hypothetical protein [Candidatus Woesearchaeota archaeon]
MEKRDIFVLVIFLLVAVGAVAIMYYSDAVGQAWFQKQIILQQRTPSPKAAPPAPTPVPAPRITTTESAKKPEFPPEALYYLQPGKYTTPADEIKQIKIKPISVGDIKPGRKAKPWEQNILEFNQIRGIFKYMNEFPKYKKNDDNSWDLTVNDIFKKGINDNYCGQYGRLFITLARANGIPAKYLQSYNKNWADGQKQNNCWFGDTQGHVYAQIYVDGNWHGVDPTKRSFVDITDKGTVLDSQGNVQAVIFAEGKDHGDILPHINRWCLEGLRYHTAIPGLLLCPGKRGPDKNQLMMMLACKEPLDLVEFQKKDEK